MRSKSSILTATFLLLSVGGSMLVPSGDANAGEEKNNYVGPTIGFVSGQTLYGITSKFKIADNISARPFIEFASFSDSSGTATISLYGASAVYDFKIPNSEFNPYAGIGILGASVSYSVAGNSGSVNLGSGVYFEAGADYNASDSIVINANYKFKDSGYFSVGGGWRF